MVRWVGQRGFLIQNHPEEGASFGSFVGPSVGAYDAVDVILKFFYDAVVDVTLNFSMKRN